MLAKPLDFGDLSLEDKDDTDARSSPINNEARLMEMIAAQAAHSTGPGFRDEDAVVADETLSDDEKRDMLQKSLNMAASNGDVERIRKILSGKAREFVDINAPDDDGTPALIYASCFVRTPDTPPAFAQPLTTPFPVSHG